MLLNCLQKENLSITNIFFTAFDSVQEGRLPFWLRRTLWIRWGTAQLWWIWLLKLGVISRPQSPESCMFIRWDHSNIFICCINPDKDYQMSNLILIFFEWTGSNAHWLHGPSQPHGHSGQHSVFKQHPEAAEGHQSRQGLLPLRAHRQLRLWNNRTRHPWHSRHAGLFVFSVKVYGLLPHICWHLFLLKVIHQVLSNRDPGPNEDLKTNSSWQQFLQEHLDHFKLYFSRSYGFDVLFMAVKACNLSRTYRFLSSPKELFSFVWNIAKWFTIDVCTVWSAAPSVTLCSELRSSSWSLLLCERLALFLSRTESVHTLCVLRRVLFCVFLAHPGGQKHVPSPPPCNRPAAPGQTEISCRVGGRKSCSGLSVQAHHDLCLCLHCRSDPPNAQNDIPIIFYVHI